MELHEYHDEYSESLAADLDFRKLEGALFEDTVKLLAPSEPLRFPPRATVQEAVQAMVAHRRAAVVVVDAEDRLIGILNRADILARVVGAGRDPRQTAVSEVMTPNPEALVPSDRICYAINRMTAAGYRTIPLVDEQYRPVGIVTVNDVVHWLASLFPEALLNLRPGDQLKRPADVDAG